MKNRTSSRRRVGAGFLLASLFLLSSICVAVVGAREWLRRPPVAAAMNADTQGGPDVNAFVFTMRPDGLWPSEITLPKGKYLLVVQNRTGLESLSLSLSREAGGKLHEVNLNNKLEWRQWVELAPGTYVITESDHQAWTCRITVDPHE